MLSCCSSILIHMTCRWKSFVSQKLESVLLHSYAKLPKIIFRKHLLLMFCGERSTCLFGGTCMPISTNLILLTIDIYPIEVFPKCIASIQIHLITFLYIICLYNSTFFVYFGWSTLVGFLAIIFSVWSVRTISWTNHQLRLPFHWNLRMFLCNQLHHCMKNVI